MKLTCPSLLVLCAQQLATTSNMAMLLAQAARVAWCVYSIECVYAQ